MTVAERIEHARNKAIADSYSDTFAPRTKAVRLFIENLEAQNLTIIDKEAIALLRFHAWEIQKRYAPIEDAYQVLQKFIDGL